MPPVRQFSGNGRGGNGEAREAEAGGQSEEMGELNFHVVVQ